jgi:transcriptional regulator with XRE-family HTH domain
MSHRTFPDLATYLKETGLTQLQLARKLNISQAYMSKLVRRLQQPSLDEALRISRACRIPVESLVASASQPDELLEQK